MMRVAILLAGVASPAVAAINPCYLDQMVAGAPTVVQIVAPEVGRPDRGGACRLEGEVARSFRGTLAVGERVGTVFACEDPEGMVGGTTYHERGAVARAGAVELHLDAGGLPAGQGWGLLPLDGATEAPAFPFEHLPASGSC